MAKKETNKEKIAKNKSNLLEVLRDNLGNISGACETCKLSRQTFYRYYNEDPEFADQVDDISEIALDFVEDKLFTLIKDNNPAAIMFFLKCKGKKRGYIERQEFDFKTRDGLKDKTIEELEKEWTTLINETIDLAEDIKEN